MHIKQCKHRNITRTERHKQCVALTRRNATAPPCVAVPPGELRCICGALQTTTDDDDRHQRPLLVWPTYSMCRRTSNNVTSACVIRHSWVAGSDGANGRYNLL